MTSDAQHSAGECEWTILGGEEDLSLLFVSGEIRTAVGRSQDS